MYYKNPPGSVEALFSKSWSFHVDVYVLVYPGVGGQYFWPVYCTVHLRKVLPTQHADRNMTSNPEANLRPQEIA